MKHSFMSVFCFLMSVACLAQTAVGHSDSLVLNKMEAHSHRFKYANFILPAALITYGVVAKNSTALKDFDKDIADFSSRKLKHKTHFDDYILYAPAVATLGLDFLGVRAKHNFRDRAIVLVASYAYVSALSEGMKATFSVARPDGSDRESFPSGHTARAFVGAHLLFKEYYSSSPLLGVSGYAVAVLTGAMRVVNNRHWMSDVAAGAGVGLLSAELGYMSLPVVHKLLGIKSESCCLSLVPSVSAKSAGFYLSYSF